MREIKLTKGLVALVDDSDFEYLSMWKWCASQEGRNGSKWYAIRWSTTIEHGTGKRFKIRMHRVLMCPEIGLVVDHLNSNGLDNRRSNLECVTQAENMKRAPGYFKRKVS